MPRSAPTRAWVVVSLVLSLGFVPRAWAERSSPESAFVRELAASLSDRSSDSATAVRLEWLWSSWDFVGPAPILPALERLAESRRTSRWIRDAARWHLAEAALRQGRVSDARDRADELGSIRSYLILGPLDNEGDAGLERRWPPEDELTAPLDLDVGVEGARRQVRWREVAVPDTLGRLRFDGYLHPIEGVCAYAVTFVELERARPMVVAASTSGAVVLWINGREVWRDPVYRELHPDRFAVRLTLPSGTSRITAKVCGDEDSAPQLLLRATDPNGDARGGDFQARPELARRTPAKGWRGPARIEATPFSTLLERATRRRATGADKALAARFLYLTGADDPAEPLAYELAAAADGATNDRDTALLAAALAPERNVARARLELLADDTPEDPLVLSSLARIVAQGPDPQRARPILAKLARSAPASVGAALIDSALLARSGLPLAGQRRLERTLELTGPIPVLHHAAADLAVRAARIVDQERHLEALARLRADSIDVHRDLAILARDRGKRQQVVPHLDALDQLAWHRTENRIWTATVREQLGFVQPSLDSLRRLNTQSPDQPEGWAAYARVLAGLGRAQETLEPLNRALELEPQNQRLRDLRAHLLDLDPFEDEYIEAPETFLARRGAGGGQHARWLLDLTVSKVHPSGLSSRFRQIAIEILDEEGARGLRGHAIGFVPLEQRVTVRRARIFRGDGTVEEASGRFIQRMNDPSIRMYYDTRAEVIELPRLRPGDVVEYAYRVDDIASRNLMGNYFGEIVVLQGDEPSRRVAFVLIHPNDVEIHHHSSELAGLRLSRNCDDGPEGSCTSSWEATDVAGLPREEHRPPTTELGARLALSTYDEWDAVGRWFWGLVRDQLVPDDQLRSLVRELVDGLESDEAKVRAIHRWVVENTRYVALEFGIHGYQPYPVTQVVDRGFGDCKDKASLLVTMLGLAGVEASLVLLRTRASGIVPPNPPSLALFDHAIAYVPSLDLFLDGTAEQSGTTELPWMDQGVTALIVSTDGSSRLVTTPVDEAARNVEQWRTNLVVGTAGPPVMGVRHHVSGFRAAGLRFHFQAAGLREERLGRRLSASWPGLRLLGHDFGEIEDREHPVELSARFEAPSATTADGSRRAIEISRPRELTRRWARRSSRRTPLELGGPPHREEEERRVELPEGARVVRLPESVSIRSPYGSLQVDTSSSGTSVVIRTILEINRYRIAPTEYEEFRRFLQSLDRILERRLIIEVP